MEGRVYFYWSERQQRANEGRAWRRRGYRRMIKRYEKKFLEIVSTVNTVINETFTKEADSDIVQL